MSDWTKIEDGCELPDTVEDQWVVMDGKVTRGSYAGGKWWCTGAEGVQPTHWRPIEEAPPPPPEEPKRAQIERLVPDDLHWEYGDVFVTIGDKINEIIDRLTEEEE